MILERLLIIAILSLVGTGAFVVFKQGHLRRVNVNARAFAGGQPTLLYFRSDTCAACPTQSRYVENLVQGGNGRFTLQSIDVDSQPDKAKEYGVMTLPTTMIIDANGQVKEINYGLTPSHKLQKQLSLV